MNTPTIAEDPYYDDTSHLKREYGRAFAWAGRQTTSGGYRYDLREQCHTFWYKIIASLYYPFYVHFFPK